MMSTRHIVILSTLCTLFSAYPERERVHDLMVRYPLIDGHNDLPLQLRRYHNNQLSQMDLHNLTKFSTDIGRLRVGHIQAQMFSVYVMCGAQEKDAVQLTLEQIDVVRRMCTEYQDFELVTSVQGIVHLLKRAHVFSRYTHQTDLRLKNSAIKSKIACLISIEGGHSIGSSLPTLRMFYLLGVRSMTLTHNCNTPWAESSSRLYAVFQRENNSLTLFGQAVVEEMNRLGMIVDVSHASWDTALTVMKHSKAPVIFSHSSSYFICKHHRNVPDWLLRELKKSRGLIMVNLHSNFITCRDEANISHVADHFDHIREVIGAESIGIGGDYEGVQRFPQGLEDVSKYPHLIHELLQRNWTENELAGVLRRNFLRVFEEVERVRDQLRSNKPSEVQISSEEVQNPCRLDLRPKLRQSAISSTVFSNSNEQKNLFFLAIVLLLSSIFTG